MNAQKIKPEADEKKDWFRFQLELSASYMDRLNDLVRETDSASRAEVIRRALGFYALLVKETKAGGRIEIVPKKGDRRELVVLEAH